MYSLTFVFLIQIVSFSRHTIHIYFIFIILQYRTERYQVNEECNQGQQMDTRVLERIIAKSTNNAAGIK